MYGIEDIEKILILTKYKLDSCKRLNIGKEKIDRLNKLYNILLDFLYEIDFI